MAPAASSNPRPAAFAKNVDNCSSQQGKHPIILLPGEFAGDKSLLKIFFVEKNSLK